MVLLSLLGVFIAWNYVKKTNTGTVQQIEAVQSTLRPNPNAVSPDVFSGQR